MGGAARFGFARFGHLSQNHVAIIGKRRRDRWKPERPPHRCGHGIEGSQPDESPSLRTLSD